MESLAAKIPEIIQNAQEQINPEKIEYSHKQVFQDLKENYFGSKDLSDFFELKQKGLFPTTGEFSFVVENKFLKYACNVLRYTSGGSKLTGNFIKLTLFKNQLRLSGNNSHTFSETFIPLAKTCLLQEPIFFICDFGVISKITTTFENSSLSFTYFAKTQLLKLEQGNTVLELPTFSEIDFTHNTKSIKNVEKINCAVPLLLWQQAFEYVSLFAQTDKNQQYPQVDVQGGKLVGGTGVAIGIFKTAFWENNPLKIKYESLGNFIKVIPFFHPTKTQLFESEKWFILRDSNLYVGFEKPSGVFPNVSTLLSKEFIDSFEVSREDLLQAFNYLAIVTTNQKNFISFRIKGQKDSAILTLSIKDLAGRISKHCLPILRKKECETREYLLPLEFLVKLLQKYTSEKIEIHESQENGIHIQEKQELHLIHSIIAPGMDV